MSSLREQILDKDDFNFEMYTSPEWGVTVKVKSISQAARAQLIKECTDPPTERMNGDGVGKTIPGEVDTAKWLPALIIATFCDPINGQPIFQKEDRDVLAAKNVRAINAAFNVASRVCGFTESSDKAIEKNSERTASSAASSV